MFLTALPLLWGWLNTPPGQEFTGFLFNANDGNTYLAKMAEGRQGSWVFHLAHTSEQGGDGAITYVFYLLLGKLAGLLHLSNILIFHLARLAAGLFLLLVSYRFIKLLFVDQLQQRFAFRLVCLSAGLGWALIIVNPTPPDFWVAEGYTFQSIFANPHFPLATALLILTITEVLLAMEGRGRVSYFKAALASFCLGFVHPFLLFSLAGILGLFWLRLTLHNRRINWPSFVALILVGLAGVPGPFLTWWGTEHDPLLKQWMQQNQTVTLDPLTTIGGYGLLIPLALAGVWWVERILPHQNQREKYPQQRWWLVTGWLFITVILLALPLNFSRRFVEGLHLPLCCLATAGYYQLLTKSNQYRLKEKLLVFVLSLSSLALVVLSIVLLYLPPDNILDPVRSPYLSQGEVRAIAWLSQNSQPSEIIITGPVLGNVLPGRVLRPVFYGHSMETIDADHKFKLLKEFFDKNTSNLARQQFISTWDLKYLVYGWREQRFGGFDPALAAWPVVYNQAGVRIYLLS